MQEKGKEKTIYADQIEGRNSVLELLESGKDINKIFVTKGEKHGSIHKIIAKARERKIIIVEKDKRQMEEMAQTQNYQGVIAIVPPFEYCEIEDILNEAKKRKEEPFVLILDGIEDPLFNGERISKCCKIANKMIENNLSYDMNNYVYLDFNF